jgi:four helix bundle protein
MKNFKKLRVWQKSMFLVRNVYLLVKHLPLEEKYGLQAQLTRAVISIPSNIAEGCSRNSPKEFRRFLEIALGSSFELETQLLVVQELKLSTEKISELIEQTCEIEKMLQGLIQKLTKQILI